jgi:hypothetical protein
MDGEGKSDIQAVRRSGMPTVRPAFSLRPGISRFPFIIITSLVAVSV